MKVHVFGLPLNVHRRLKQESENWRDAVPDGHIFRATPSSSNQMGPFSEPELRELLQTVSEGFTHIVLPGSRNWQEVRDRWRFDCRIHLARLREPVKDLTWPILREHLRAVVLMDELWLSRLSPHDLRHALLLPPAVFATNRETAEYWRYCDAYSKDVFTSAEQLLAKVEEHHRHPDPQGGRSWLDARGRRFRIDQARHGRSEADRAGMRSFRFCFEMPAGFHYDVSDDIGRTINVDIDGHMRAVSHFNVTPWGKLRRG